MRKKPMNFVLVLLIEGFSPPGNEFEEIYIYFFLPLPIMKYMLHKEKSRNFSKVGALLRSRPITSTQKAVIPARQ